jgi:predicted MPP superfamily phosphohydrolase
MQDTLSPKLPIAKKSTEYKYDGFTILLTHQPIALEKLRDFPIDLELA